MSEIECWADLPGFEGYKISTQGRVAKTNGGEPPMILVPRKHKGRMYYRCRQDGRIREVRADRAVAQTFIQQQLTGYEIRHRDGDPWNCAAKNLSVAPRRFIGQKVVKIDAAGNVLEIYDSAMAAGRDNYMNYQTVLNRCRGRTRDDFQGDGFSFRFAEGAK